MNKELVSSINIKLKELNDEVEIKIMENKFRFLDGLKTDKSKRTISIQLYGDDTVFEIWNANESRHTEIYSIKATDFEIDCVKLKFSNPKNIRNKLRGDSDEFKQQKKRRLLAEINNIQKEIEKINN